MDTREALDLGRRQLAEGESSSLDVELMLGSVTGRDRASLLAHPEKPLTAEEAEAFRRLLDRRRAGVPVAYLTGEREFWSMCLRVTPDTLIPRPETELLVETALSLERRERIRVADLGTGTGAVALALGRERPGWEVHAVERSAGAAAVAEANRATLGCANVRCRNLDWNDLSPDEPFDMLVSNPPYVEAGSDYLGTGDVRFEPRAALVAGVDGLDAIRGLAALAPRLLRRPGRLLVEHGFAQGAAVRELLENSGFREVATRCDLVGHERVTFGRLV